MLIALQKTEDSFLQQGLHLVLGKLVFVGVFSCFFEIATNENGLI